MFAVSMMMSWHIISKVPLLQLSESEIKSENQLNFI